MNCLVIAKFKSVDSPEMDWKVLKPNEQGDWINQGNDVFDTFIPIEPENKNKSNTQSFFKTYAIGVSTNRDAWVYNFNKQTISSNMKRLIDYYNQQIPLFSAAKKKSSKLTADDFLKETDTTKISWTVNLKKDLEKGLEHKFNKSAMSIGAYRPFSKQDLYFDRPFIERPGLCSEFFPNAVTENSVICVSPSVNDGLAVLITNTLPNLHFNGDSQCFPLYYYEERTKENIDLFDAANDSTEFLRRDGISDFILDRAKKMYGKNVIKEDLFYYVYGFLHTPLYRKTFVANLNKGLPRLPLVDEPRDFWKFSKAGRELAELHINYESVPAYEDLKVTGGKNGFYEVVKMRFPKKDQKGTIIYNSKIVIENIPEKAYSYTINGTSAIEWIMERYQITTHKESGITNDPNDWAKEVANPRYILDLLLSIINVSMKTMKIVEGLPQVKFE